MTRKADQTAGAKRAELRRQAEETFREKTARSPENLDALSPADIQRLLYELRVHQIELEMQNEELRRTQAELEVERERYFEFFELAPVGFFTLSEQGLILEGNLTVAGMLGVPRGALVKQPFTRFIFREDADIHQLRRQQLLATGRPQVYELRMLKKDGTCFWAHLATSVVQNTGGALLYRIVLSDLSESKNVEEALRESEQNFRNLVWDMQVGVLLQDSQAKILLSNPKALELLGISEDQLLGKTSFDPDWNVIHADGSPFPGPDHPVPQAIATRHSVLNRIMGVYRPASAERIWLSVDAEPQLNADGTVRQVVCTFVDISDRLRAEDALREANAYLENLLNYANAPIIVWDPQFRITRFNHAFEFLTGRSEAEVLGQSLEILFPPALAANAMVQIHKTLTGERWETIEIEILHRDGSLQTVLWNSATLFSPDGQTPIATIAQGHNITRRKQAEEKILLLNAELEEQAMTDYLTHLFNGRYFMQRGAEEFKRAQRYHQPLALLMIDIDEFKIVNDTHGHEAGDLALKQVADALKSCLRATDMLGRLGGDEFGVLLPNTALNEAGQLVERIQQTIAEMTILKPDGAAIRPITVSVGAAAVADDLPGFEDLLRNADAAMYGSKKTRQNAAGVPGKGVA